MAWPSARCASLIPAFRNEDGIILARLIHSMAGIRWRVSRKALIKLRYLV